MLWTLVVILVVIWLLAMAGSYTMSGFIYVLPILAVITLIIQLVTGRRAPFEHGTKKQGRAPSQGALPASVNFNQEVSSLIGLAS